LEAWNEISSETIVKHIGYEQKKKENIEVYEIIKGVNELII